MKIFQLIQAKQYRGAEIFCCQFSNHLLDLGHEVIIVSIYGGPATLPFKKEIISLNRPKKRKLYDFKGWRNLANLIKEFKPDVIQANAADTLVYAIFSKIVFQWNVPVIYRNASLPSFYIDNPVSKIYNRFLLKKVNYIISVSNSSKKDINTLFPFTKSKTVVIPVGIDKQEIIYSRNGFKPNKLNIVHVGSFTREKNHHELIDIFKILLKKSNAFNLHLIGDGALRECIEKRVVEENLEEKVFLHGGLNYPLSYIKAADVLILPSIIEGLPGVLLEAMYCRTPVIAYDVGGIGEIIFPETGILIKKGDKEAFAEAIFAMSKKSDRNKIEKAYLQVTQKYLNKEIAKDFLKIYQDIVRNK